VRRDQATSRPFHCVTLASCQPEKRKPFSRNFANVSRWCPEVDYLAANHRLLEADGMRKEDANTGDVDFYSPQELHSCLTTPPRKCAVIIAFAIFRRLAAARGVKARLARRVVLFPAILKSVQRKANAHPAASRNQCTLAAWLEEHRDSEGKVDQPDAGCYTWQLIHLRKGLKIPSKKNGLRHGFHFSAHYAIYQNEGMEPPPKQELAPRCFSNSIGD